MRTSVQVWLASARLALVPTFNPAGKHLVGDRKAKNLYTNYNSRFMRLDSGQEIHYQDEGEGPPLVLLHGFGGSLHLWDQWATHLHRNFRIIRVDLPGFGLSSHIQEEVGVEFFLDFLNEFLDRLGLEKCSIAGNSLGGWISWEFAGQFPERVEKLILMSPAGFFDKKRPKPNGVSLLTMPVFRKLLRTGIPKSIIRRTLRSIYGKKKLLSQEIIDRYYVISNREGNLASMMAVAISQATSNLEKLDQIHHPTLMFWGEKDQVISVDFAKEFLEKIPQANLVKYPDAGHVVMVEEPIDSANRALAFLTGDQTHKEAVFKN